MPCEDFEASPLVEAIREHFAKYPQPAEPYPDEEAREDNCQ